MKNHVVVDARDLFSYSTVQDIHERYNPISFKSIDYYGQLPVFQYDVILKGMDQFRVIAMPSYSTNWNKLLKKLERVLIV